MYRQTYDKYIIYNKTQNQNMKYIIKIRLHVT